MRGQSRAEPRSQCTTGGQRCAATTGTPCYRWRTAADVVTWVLTRRSHGGPIQAIGAAGGLAERTVAAWLTRAGPHGQQVPQPGVQHGQGDLPHGQADARWVTRVGRRVWMALALAVPARLGLGGVISPHRDRVLSTRLVPLVRSGGRSLALLGGVDGLASDVTAFLHVCRAPVRPGHRGRPRWVLEAGLRLGPGGKREVQRRGARVEPRVGRGTAAALAGVVAAHRRELKRLNNCNEDQHRPSGQMMVATP